MYAQACAHLHCTNPVRSGQEEGLGVNEHDNNRVNDIRFEQHFLGFCEQASTRQGVPVGFRQFSGVTNEAGQRPWYSPRRN